MIQPLIFTAIDKEYIANGLKKAVSTSELATKFWQPLTQYPIKLIIENNYSRAQGLLLHLLHTCKNIDPDSYERIHKGNPYYFLGIASYWMNDFETATYFMDAAASEDLNDGADAENNPRQSTYFLALQGEKTDQAARILVQYNQEKVQRAMDYYNFIVGCPTNKSGISIENLRKKFLFKGLSKNAPPGWRTLVTTFINFFTEWDFRNQFFDIRQSEGTLEPFYLHLFKGCVLFESLLKENPTKPPDHDTLHPVLNDLYQELGFSSKLNIPNRSTLKAIIADISTANNQLETAFVFSARVRNTTGHRISWDEQIKQCEYKRLYQMIATSCLHTISSLY